jgi:hypothetical protein
MKDAFEMGSGVMIYILSFIKIGSGIQKFKGGFHRHTRHQGDLISLLLFFQNKKSSLKVFVGSIQQHWAGSC